MMVTTAAGFAFFQSSSSSLPAANHQAENIYKVYILRHGQTNANAGGIIQGSADFSRLTPLGKQQAADTLQAFRNDDAAATIISSLYCSPLTRAQQTLQTLRDLSSSASSSSPIVLPETTITLENLREIDFYDWEGLDKTKLIRRFPDSWKAWMDGDPEGLMVLDSKNNGEQQQRFPLLEMWSRADQVWDEILQLQRNKMISQEDAPKNSGGRQSLIVAHGSLGQALLGTAMGWGASQFRQHEFPNCGMVEIDWHMDGSGDGADWWTNDNTNINSRRPFATRWRWKWPTPSEDWNTLISPTGERLKEASLR